MSERRLRVLVVIKGLAAGGAERLVTTMIRRRDRERFDFEVAYVIDALNELAPELAAEGIPLHPLGGRGNLDASWIPRLRRLVRDGNFDVVHTHLSYTAIGTRLVMRSLPRRRRSPVVYTEHSVRDHLRLPIRALAWLTFPLDDRILAVGQSTLALLPRKARRRTEVVWHGVDRAACVRSDEQRRALRTELGVGDDDLLVVTVANLRDQKDYPNLLRATKILVDEGWPVKVAAAGIGSLLDELTAMRHELGLDERFRFLGFYPDPVTLCAAADVFVLASGWEVMPVAIMEAMTVGAAIVSTAVGDVPYALDDGVTGRLVPPENAEALAAGLRDMFADPDLRRRYGAAAAQASERFDIDRATRRLEDIYVELAGADG